MACFVRELIACSNKFSETDILKMLEFPIDIFVDFQKIVCMPNGHKSCALTGRIVFVLV